MSIHSAMLKYQGISRINKMEVFFHFAVSVLIAIMLYFSYGIQVYWVLIGGFLIDTDHYLHYIFRFKKFDIKKAYAYYSTDLKNKYILNIFHTAEFFILIAVLLRYYPNEAFLFLAGYLPHQLMDYIYVKQTAYKSFRSRSPSLILWFLHHYTKLKL